MIPTNRSFIQLEAHQKHTIIIYMYKNQNHILTRF